MAKIGQSQQEYDAEKRLMTLYLSVIMGLIFVYMFGYIGSLAETEGTGILSAFPLFLENISSGKLLYQVNSKAIVGFIVGVVAAFGTYFFTSLDNEKRQEYNREIVAGSGGFMTKKELKAYAKKYIAPDPPPIVGKSLPVAADIELDKDRYSKNMIMSNNFCRPINSRKLIGNNNILIVGGAGTGKSRFFIKPNMLQMNASYVITDPSGEMIYSLGKTLREHGYKIKIFNISDMSHSNCYNPLNYIRDEAGVNMLIQCFITNTTQGEGGGDNQFFVDAEKLLYSACIFYLLDFCHDDTQKNFANILNMINASSVNEQDPNAKSPLDALFDKLPQDALAWKYYKAFKQAAGKTLKSIIISCVTRLQPFMTPQVINLTKRDELDLGSIGNEKTALFIITPQADRTYSFLASMLYSQLFETLYHIGEQQKANGESEQLHIPVRCMMDEFANIGEVPEFPSKLATMRKYNISAAIVLQDISQIEAMYEDNWKTLVGNCSTIVFLGTQEPNTLKYFSEMLGNMTVAKRGTSLNNGKQKSSGTNTSRDKREVMTPDELGRMPSNECIVFTQNMRPVKDLKYDYNRHPYYGETADADDSRGFQYNKMSAYSNTNSGNIENVLKAQAEAKMFKARMARKEQEEKDKVNTSADVLRGNATAEEKQYRNMFMDCQIQMMDLYSEPCGIILVPAIPTEYLIKLTNEISATLKKYPIMIFTDTAKEGFHDDVVGVGIDQNGELEKYLKRHTNRLSKRGKNYLVTVPKDNFETFKESLLEEMSKEQSND